MGSFFYSFVIIIVGAGALIVLEMALNSLNFKLERRKRRGAAWDRACRERVVCALAT